MDLKSRLREWFSPPPVETPSTTAVPPAQIFIHQPAPKSSRKTMLGAAVVLVAAAWIGLAMWHPPASGGAQTAEMSTASVDKGRVQQIIDALTKKNAELDREQAAAVQQIQDHPPGPPPGYGMPGQVAPAQPLAKSLAEERRERAYKSLFSSPVISVRSDDAQPPLTRLAQTLPAASKPSEIPEKPTPAPPDSAAAGAGPSSSSDCVDLEW